VIFGFFMLFLPIFIVCIAGIFQGLAGGLRNVMHGQGLHDDRHAGVDPYAVCDSSVLFSVYILRSEK